MSFIARFDGRCHDTGGSAHDHPGRPYPGKTPSVLRSIKTTDDIEESQ